MKAFKLKELGELKKGERLRSEDMEDGDVPFVGATEFNNGITARCAAPADHTVHPKGCITVPYNGSIGYAFLQPEPFLASDDVNTLYPYTDNLFAKLYICQAIRQERCRFNYGRKWHFERMLVSTILLPSNGDLPDYQRMAEDVGRAIPNFTWVSGKATETSPASPTITDVVRLRDLFHIHNGVSATSLTIGPEPEDGFIALRCPSKTYEGTLVGYVDPEEVKREKVFPKNTIMVGTNGEGSHTYSYVMSEAFVPNSDVVALVPK